MVIDEEVYDFLDHAGVKGMKWGVRRQRRLESLQRVSKGQGSLRETARAALTTSAPDILRGRGVRGGVALRAERVEGRKKRVQAGKATALDVLKHVGSTRLTDLGPLDR